MKKFLIFCTFAFLLSCQSELKEPISHYNFSVELEPETGTIISGFQFEYLHNAVPTDTLKFYLHKELKISSLNCSKYRSHFIIDSSDNLLMPNASIVNIVLSEPVLNHEMLDINLKYSGKILPDQVWGANQISKNWIELNNLSPWYLYKPDIEQMTFGGVVKLVGDYKMTSNAMVRNGDNYFISTEAPLNDIVIIAAKDFKLFEKTFNAYHLNFYYRDLNKDIVEDFTVKSLNSLAKFIKWFGDIKLKNHSIVVSNRTQDADYSREGIYSLTKFNDRSYMMYQKNYLRYMTREFSKLWWNNATNDNWESWLNETFAEYSSLMIFRESEGKSEFTRKLLKKGKDAELYPPLKGLDPSHQYYNHVLKNKSCLILFQLEKEIGKEKFIDLLKTIHKKKLHTTNELIELIKDIHGKTIADKFVESINR